MAQMFNGELFFIRIDFTIKNQNNSRISISNNDMIEIINYAEKIVVPITQYASQYGTAGATVNKNVIQYSVTLDDASFDDGDLGDWVKDISAKNNLPANACPVVLKHDSIADSSWDDGTGGKHYHDDTPYILSSVAGDFDINGDLWKDGIKLAVRDTNWQFAGSLSHEIAEMMVNPFGGNPEVCDPCGPNCVSTYLNYFDAVGNYVITSQSPPYVVTKNKTFDFAYYMNGIVTPKHSSDCPAPAEACTYAPPLLWRRLFGNKLRQIAVGRNSDGRLEVFAIGGNRSVYHTWQNIPNGDWHIWDNLNGHDIMQIVVANNADGRLEVFALGDDKSVYHIWQNVPNGDWGHWKSLGGHDLEQIAVANNVDGRLEVFALGGDKSVYHIWQVIPNGDWGNWKGLGGHDLRQIAVGNNADGRLEVFALGGDKSVYHIWQVIPNGDWGNWKGLGGHDLRQIVVGNNADGRLEVFAIGGNKSVYHIWQVIPNGDWANWDNLNGHDIEQITIARNADGRLELFALGHDHIVYHIWQIVPNGNWDKWDILGVAKFDQVAIGTNADGRLEAFGLGTDTTLYHIWQNAPNGGWNDN